MSNTARQPLQSWESCESRRSRPTLLPFGTWFSLHSVCSWESSPTSDSGNSLCSGLPWVARLTRISGLCSEHLPRPTFDPSGARLPWPALQPPQAWLPGIALGSLPAARPNKTFWAWNSWSWGSDESFPSWESLSGYSWQSFLTFGT